MVSIIANKEQYDAYYAGIEVWYRFEDRSVSRGVDEYGEPYPGPGETEVQLFYYPVIRYTEKGVWLSRYGGINPGIKDGRFVLKGSRKRFACPTVEEALKSFRARKKAQLRILNAQVRHVEKALLRADEYDKNKVR